MPERWLGAPPLDITRGHSLQPSICPDSGVENDGYLPLGPYEFGRTNDRSHRISKSAIHVQPYANRGRPLPKLEYRRCEVKRQRC